MIYNALDNNTHEFDYRDAIDLASNIAKDDGYEWRYVVEIIASKPSQAKIAVYDEDNIKLGYL